MIHYLKGTLAIKYPESIIIETGGIGFKVFVPSNSDLYLVSEGTDVTVFTFMMVKEDDISLYGFSSESQLELFSNLITVSGVGAKAAVAILSSMNAEDIKKAIVTEDVAMLTKANGVGKKTAQRIVLELKDKLGIPVENYIQNGQMPGDEKAEAIDALISLGYSRSEATTAVIGLEKGLTAEQYIKLALRKI